FNAQDRGYLPVLRVSASGGMPVPVTPETYNSEFALSRDGQTLVLARSSSASPAELVVSSADGSVERPLTSHNAERLARLDLPDAEHFTFAGAGGSNVHAMLLRPPSFDASKKYPVVMVL